MSRLTSKKTRDGEDVLDTCRQLELDVVAGEQKTSDMLITKPPPGCKIHEWSEHAGQKVQQSQKRNSNIKSGSDRARNEGRIGER